MKIEIEFEKVEALKREISQQEDRIKKLEAELKSLDKHQLRKDAVELAKFLFDQYQKCVFVHLGFKDNDRQKQDSVIFNSDLEHWLGKDWYNSDRISINIGAHITQRWRSAFVSIGIKPKPDDNE